MRVVSASFLKFIFIFLCEYVCLSMCVSVYVYVGAQGGKKRLLDVLELELFDDYLLSYLSAGR